MTSTIKQLADTKNILTEQVKTITVPNAYMTAKGVHKQQHSGQATMNNGYRSKIDPTGYCCICGFKVVMGHTSLTFVNRNDGYKEKANIYDTMGVINNNSVCFAGDWVLW